MGALLALALIDGLVQGYDSFDDGHDRDWTRPMSASTVVTVPSASGFLRSELVIPVEGPVSAARLAARWFQAPPPAGAPPRL